MADYPASSRLVSDGSAALGDSNPVGDTKLVFAPATACNSLSGSLVWNKISLSGTLPSTKLCAIVPGLAAFFIDQRDERALNWGAWSHLVLPGLVPREPPLL